MRTSSSGLYVIGDYAEAGFSVLDTKANTLADCQRMIAWQNTGGFNTVFHICRPTDERGVFEEASTGKRFATNRGALTEAAYSDLLASVWGAPNFAKEG